MVTVTSSRITLHETRIHIVDVPNLYKITVQRPGYEDITIRCTPNIKTQCFSQIRVMHPRCRQGGRNKALQSIVEFAVQIGYQQDRSASGIVKLPSYPDICPFIFGFQPGVHMRPS